MKLINRRFARDLLVNLLEGTKGLSETHDRALYSLDVYWHKLQAVSKWYVFKPKMGYQIPSYSDIEKRYVNYAYYGI